MGKEYKGLRGVKRRVKGKKGLGTGRVCWGIGGKFRARHERAVGERHKGLCMKSKL